MIRFYLIVVLFLISLLAFLKAPQYHLWLLSIAVTEFPLVFFGITLLITLTGFWTHKYQATGTVLGTVVMLIYLSPIARAYWVARDIKSEMSRAFSGIPQNASQVVFPGDRRPPFSFWSLLKRQEAGSFETLSYTSYDDRPVTLDFYPAKVVDPELDVLDRRPCVIVIHGGSWSGGDSRQLPELNSYLAQRGFNVAAINYRLAPQWKFPAQVEDVSAAMHFLKTNAEKLRIDTGKLVLLGRSAGAQIALLAAYTLKEQGLRGVIDFYGPADMVWGYSVPSSPLIMDSRKVMRDYLGGSYSEAPQKYFDSSPVEFAANSRVPALMIHGMNDVLVSPRHNVHLIKKLQAAGAKYYWLKLPWATHGFDCNLYGPGGQLSTYAVETFLNTITQ